MGLRDKLHSKPAPPVNPDRPHGYEAPGEHWLGHGVPPVGGPGAQFGLAPVNNVGASLQFADRRCAICRRAKDDLIHAPQD
ncbi:MAG: hypothetical protein U0838_03870 [Chloroflexota bacterium]